MNNLTKPEDIILETQKVINNAKNSLIDLNESCISFIFLYDDYNEKNLYDADLLKEKIKNVILRTVSNDI